jgi:hypothetical protein
VHRIAALTALVFVFSVAGCASTEVARQPADLGAAGLTGNAAARAADPAPAPPPGCDASFLLGKLSGSSLMRLADETPGELVKAAKAPHTHPAIHGPYSMSMLLDFIAPSTRKLDEAYGIDSRLMIRAFDSIYLGGAVGYARMKNEDREGLIEGGWATRRGRLRWMSPSGRDGFSESLSRSPREERQ